MKAKDLQIPGVAADLMPIQAEILESIALAEPLNLILDRLCKLSEELVQECVASVMMYDNSRSFLNVLSAPNLPQDAVNALNGMVPGPGAGSCANAVDTGKPTFVCDVMLGGEWSKVRNVAKQFNIGACWSFPIYIHGEVCGSFAITSFRGREPSDLHEQLLKTSAHLVGFAVEREKSNEALRLSDLAFNTTSEGILVADWQGNVFKVNPAYCEMISYSQEDLGDKGLLELITEDKALRKLITTQINELGSWRGELQSSRKNGDTFPALVNITRTKYIEANREQCVAILSDISLLKASERRLSYLAHHDLLTDLPNRFAFEKILEDTLKTECTEENTFAVLFVDLDDFKMVNDSQGHATGDKMLKQVGARLRDCIRDSDVVARLGGDEFTVLVKYLDLKTVEKLAERIISRLSEMYHIDKNDYFNSASIGIALAPAHGQSYELLIKHADAAMYKAKGLGKNCYSYYSTELTQSLQTRVRMEACLRRAIDKNELSIVYQPKFDNQRKIVGLEALLRWHSEDYGDVLPSDFILLAEHAGIINRLGSWVLHNACLQLRKWCDAGTPIKMSVNVSRHQLRNGFDETLRMVLADTGIEPKLLELEITESTMLEEIERSHDLLTKIHEHGVNISIDDFGTGYSSLSDLKNLPVQSLKIDMSLVSGLPDNEDDNAIAHAIVAMGHALKLNVIAEGVETEGQFEALSAVGCDEYQGYLLGKPVSAKSISRLLEN